MEHHKRFRDSASLSRKALRQAGTLGVHENLIGSILIASYWLSDGTVLGPRKLKLRTFHAGAILAFFTSYFATIRASGLFSNVWKPSSSAPG